MLVTDYNTGSLKSEFGGRSLQLDEHDEEQASVLAPKLF
jgi:hypothetical protein